MVSSMILGITGAIGCGKSAVLAAFASHGWHVADADRLCHMFYADPAGAVVREARLRWGEKILAPDGSVDRAELAKIVFENERELAVLTGMLYPALQRQIAALTAQWRAEKTHGALEIPLLYESGIAFDVDYTVAVWADPEVRRKRLCENRGFTETGIRLREARQLAPGEKLERADFALINNGPRAELELQISDLIEQLEAMKTWMKTKN